MDEARAREVLAALVEQDAIGNPGLGYRKTAFYIRDGQGAKVWAWTAIRAMLAYAAEREAAAVSAERERCARIVEENQETWSNKGGDHQSVAPRRHQEPTMTDPETIAKGLSMAQRRAVRNASRALLESRRPSRLKARPHTCSSLVCAGVFRTGSDRWTGAPEYGITRLGLAVRAILERDAGNG